jgi:hypothetical protein
MLVKPFADAGSTDRAAGFPVSVTGGLPSASTSSSYRPLTVVATETARVLAALQQLEHPLAPGYRISQRHFSRCVKC